VRVGVATSVDSDEWKSIRVAFSFLQSYIHTHAHSQVKLNHFFLWFEDWERADSMRMQYYLMKLMAIEKYGNSQIKWDVKTSSREIFRSLKDFCLFQQCCRDFGSQKLVEDAWFFKWDSIISLVEDAFDYTSMWERAKGWIITIESVSVLCVYSYRVGRLR
jgi:hypothetical protein